VPILRADPEPGVEFTARTPVVAAACLYVATVPFDLFAVFGGRTATVPAAGLLFFLWLLDLIQTRRRTITASRVGLPLYLYCVWCLVTGLWSVSPDGTLLNWTSLALQVVTAFVLADALGDHWRAALWTTVYSSAVLACILLTNPLNESRGGRGSVGGADENITAFVLCIGVAAAIYLMLDSRGLLRPVVAGLLAAVSSAGVIYTGSRTGFLSLVGIMLVGALLMRRRANISRRLLMIAGAFLAFPLFSSMGLVPERLSSVWTDTVSGQDAGRGDIIAMYRAHFSEWAWSGVGYGADADFLLRVAGEYKNAHSMFWKTWIELGITGLVLLTLVILAILYRGRGSPTRGATSLMLAPVALFAITLGGQTSPSLWFVVALALVRSTHVDARQSAAAVTAARRSRVRPSVNSAAIAKD
jgi:O-antigen ligase